MKGRQLLYILVFLIVVMILLQYQRKAYNLPKVVWTHWDSEKPPEHVVKNIARMRKMLPDWQVNLVSTGRFLQSIRPEEVPKGFDKLLVEHQADWIRLKLLKKYGGCWMDSGILLNQSINNLYRDCVSNQAELLVFKILGMQTNPKYPVAENWFIMAPPESPIITLWLEEFESAIKMTFKNYKEKIIGEGVDLQNISKNTYLTQHGCYQKVIQHRYHDAKVVYHVAEETMFKLQAKTCKWDDKCIKEKLQDVAYCRTIPYIKLRGADRKGVNIIPLLQ